MKYLYKILTGQETHEQTIGYRIRYVLAWLILIGCITLIIQAIGTGIQNYTLEKSPGSLFLSVEQAIASDVYVGDKTQIVKIMRESSIGEVSAMANKELSLIKAGEERIVYTVRHPIIIKEDNIVTIEQQLPTNLPIGEYYWHIKWDFNVRGYDKYVTFDTNHFNVLPIENFVRQNDLVREIITE